MYVCHSSRKDLKGLVEIKPITFHYLKWDILAKFLPELKDSFLVLIFVEIMEERNDLLFLATVNFSGLVESIISFKYIVYALREIFVEIQTEFRGRLSLVQR